MRVSCSSPSLPTGLRVFAIAICCVLLGAPCSQGQSTDGPSNGITVVEDAEEIQIETPLLKAAVRKKGYVSGVKAQSLIDKSTGAHDLGFGLDIADWIMEPGSDEAYREKLPEEMVYQFNNAYHGKTAKRSIEGPQICTQARELKPEVIRGSDFVAIKQTFNYRTAAPGKNTGSLWTQILVFPNNTRYFISMQKIDAVNSSDAMFLRIDMPGHIRHNQGDTFSKVYLSYLGELESSAFLKPFAPDEKFNYTRGREKKPDRFIRAYQIKLPENPESKPWLAGMTLDPSIVSEAWCHERGYICMIEEFGGRPVKAGESFSAAFVVGFFDSIPEMEKVYDQYRGKTAIEVDSNSWSLK